MADSRKKGSTTLAIIFILTMALIVFLPPAKPDLIPRKLLFGNPEKAMPRISPDGQQLAYLAPDDDNVLNIWVQSLTGDDKQPRQISAEKKRSLHEFIWRHDNRHLLYTQDVDGDENWHIYQADVVTGVVRDLTPFHGIRADLMAHQASQPDVLLVQMNLEDRTRFDVYRVDLNSGALVLDTTNPNSAMDMTADHDLAVRAIQAYTEDSGVVIQVRDDAQSPWRDLLSWGPDETLGHISHFSNDNQSLYVVMSVGSDTASLYKVDIATGERTLIMSDPTYDISSVMVDPQNHSLQAIGIDRERFEWIPVDDSVKEDLDHLKAVGSGSYALSSRSADDRKWILAMHGDTHPAEYYLYDRDTKTHEFLFTGRPKLANYRLSAMKPIQFTASDGLQLHGYLTLPTGYRHRNLPTILYVHGGPWVRDQWGYSPSVQWLANRGYAVLQVNFRGSTGYGRNYLNAGDKEWGRRMAQDLIDAKQWVIAEGYANPERVAIYGSSYGGYATLAALTFTPLEFCCGIDIVGPSNLITLLQTLPPYWKPAKMQLNKRLGHIEEDRAMLEERSPVHFAHRIARPLLIGHGAHDPRVKKSESDQIVAAMRQNNQPVEYLVFKDEGHGFVRPENRLKFFAAMEQFLVQHLGGRAEAPSADERWDEQKQ